jgi:hypothetical protein
MKKVLLFVTSVMLVLALCVSASAASLQAADSKVAVGEKVSVVLSASSDAALDVHVSVKVPEGLKLVSGKWLKDGVIANFNGTSGVITFENEIALQGSLLELVFEGVTASDAAKTVSATIEARNASAQTVLKQSVSASVKVICDDHDFGKWVTTTKATCGKAGVQTKTCDVCKETSTRKIDALEHTFGEPVVVTAATETAVGK